MGKRKIGIWEERGAGFVAGGMWYERRREHDSFVIIIFNCNKQIIDF